jgi:hypothetical protein
MTMVALGRLLAPPTIIEPGYEDLSDTSREIERDNDKKQK